MHVGGQLSRQASRNTYRQEVKKASRQANIQQASRQADRQSHRHVDILFRQAVIVHTEYGLIVHKRHLALFRPESAIEGTFVKIKKTTKWVQSSVILYLCIHKDKMLLGRKTTNKHT